MNVSIPEEARRFVEAQVASGRYTSEDAVIEDALRRMRQQGSPPLASVRILDSDPLWGMFRDEPELMDQIVQDAMRDRRTVPLSAHSETSAPSGSGHREHCSL